MQIRNCKLAITLVPTLRLGNALLEAPFREREETGTRSRTWGKRVPNWSLDTRTELAVCGANRRIRRELWPLLPLQQRRRQIGTYCGVVI